jgi:hypothetical protein
MKKSDRKLLAETLDKALDPPARRKPALASRLADYDDDAVAATATKEATANTMGTQSTLSTHSKQAEPSQPFPVAPTRDFMKVANSIHRQALPAGLFKGKCKQIYDFLYSKTRGAMVPTRTVRLTRREIMLGADIGSTKTLFLNLRHLREVGLITWDERVGPHEGNDYTIALPEEVETQSSMGTQSTLSTLSTSRSKVHRVLRVESTQSTHSLSGDTKEGYGEPKTSFKTSTENDDDEAAAGIARAMKKLIEEVTGREATAAEFSKMIEVIDVLTLEAKIAAARTTVSSAGPFLAEHLRRRLFKKNKQELAVESAQSEPAPSSVNVKECPDCAGVGWFYPEGRERGMAKCKHLRLLEAKSESGAEGETRV